MCRRLCFALLLTLHPLVAGPPNYACGPAKSVALPKLTVSGPFTHANLTLFLLHGPQVRASKTILTLKEAMERKIVIVHETSDVNLLSVENTSPDVEIFIMSGDVVKGGKQDRAMAFDLVVPAKSGKVPLPSFCVESGRWRKRGGEDTAKFACSDNQVVGKGLKIAVNESRQQGEVWKEVAAAQAKISDNVGKNVQSASSPSSLQLALEDKDLQARLAKYEKELLHACDGKADVVGVAVAINGEISSADIFATNELFAKLWPKLLRSAATEAIAEISGAKKFAEPRAEAVTAFLAQSAQGQTKEVVIASRPPANAQQLNNAPVQSSDIGNQATTGQQRAIREPALVAANYRCQILQVVNPKSLLVESHDKEHAGIVWHRCVIAKDPPKPQPQQSQPGNNNTTPQPKDR